MYSLWNMKGEHTIRPSLEYMVARKNPIVEIIGGICAPKGYEAAGVACGIKSTAGPAKGKDVALIRSVVPANCAAVFTTNVVKSAHVPLCQERVAAGKTQVVVINSGNANCLTGKQGVADAVAATDLAGTLLDVDPQFCLIWSTGIIGRMLPMTKLTKGIRLAAAGLSSAGATDAALAITTTDTFAKQVAVEVKLSTGTVRIGGMAKGAGMISPTLATMLCFITTDAALPARTLHNCLKKAADVSLNRITIDGDMSPSDTMLVMANGQSKVTPKGADLAIFQQALNLVAGRLARMIVEDGEGATKVIAVTVDGARTEQDAVHIGRAIANSPLVKCALHAGDPNWGRIITAAGAAGVVFDPNRVDLWLGNVLAFEQGEPVKFSEARAHKELSGREVAIRLSLHVGKASTTVLTCDLSEEYVTFNADYHT